MCGKDIQNAFDNFLVWGSPPRVRERRVTIAGHMQHTGITPACAGKTSRWYRRGSTLWDHPRVCGKDENGQAATLTG